ncbi:MAG: DUF1295 domain-containing protein, partial [Bacilli bacterium]
MENMYLFSAIIVSIFFIIVFIIGQLLKNNSIVDIGWGLGFVVTVSALAWNNNFEHTNGNIVAVLILLWGLRLSFYLFKRNVGKPEDYRYVDMRRRWGTKLPTLKAFLHVYV